MTQKEAKKIFGGVNFKRIAISLMIEEAIRFGAIPDLAMTEEDESQCRKEFGKLLKQIEGIESKAKVIGLIASMANIATGGPIGRKTVEQYYQKYA